MALPIINETINYIKVKLPSGKNIGIRGWKVKEEKELLFASEKITEENPNEKIFIIENFLKACVDDKSKFDQLSENDLKKLAIEIRKLAKGDEVEYTYQCQNPECKFLFEEVLKISKTEKIKISDLSPIVINDKLTIAIKEIPLNDLLILRERFNDQLNKLIYYYMINSIEAITYEGQVYTEFTEQEIIDFIDQLDSNDLDLIYKEFENKMSNVSLQKTLKCKRCGTETQVVIDDILSFLIL